jgi:LmbE family N-acetylglucosaminyl deacetylase
MRPSRRQILSTPLAALAAGQASAAGALKIVCTGGHPDDPESGCGGTLVRFAEMGHHVTVVYLTRGEAGIGGKSHDEAAAIRTAECEAACKILGAKPVFAGQIDGAAYIDKDAVASFGKLLAAEDPDVVLAQWPIDGNLDHQVGSILTYRAWLAARGRFELYYYEVDLGGQTMAFHPTDYVDVTLVREKKKAALFAHRSQDGERIYRVYHSVMENFRGRESGCSAAEAFVHLARLHHTSRLPGVGG